MKLFQFNQEFYKILEIFPNQNQPDQRCSFTMKNLFVIAGMILFFCSLTAFFLFEAKSAEEHAYSFFISTSVLTCIAQMFSVIWKLPKMFKSFEEFEQFIEKR